MLKSLVPKFCYNLPVCLTLAGTRHFVILDGTGGGEGCDPPPFAFPKYVSVVELSEEDHRTAIGEYSRLVVCFLTLGLSLAQF